MNILVTGARAPIAADIAKALAVAGHRVWLADSWKAPIAKASPYVEALIPLPPPRKNFPAFVAGLKSVCAQLDLHSIIPTSEEVFWLAGAAPSLPASVRICTSSLATLSVLHHKGSFASLSEELGYGAPENHLITNQDQIEQLGDPNRFVFKPVYSRFATKTLIGPSSRQLQTLLPNRVNPWLAQTRIHGREYCLYNIAQEGKLLLHVAYEPRVRLGKGASLHFAPVINERLQQLSIDYIKATKFTGQISFDVIDTGNKLVALECNPRGTSGVHLAAQQANDFAAALLGTASSQVILNNLEPRMLMLPWLLRHPAFFFRKRDRARFHLAKDALTQAGIGFLPQARGLVELSWRAACMGKPITIATTADIEWNGEPMHA